MLQVFLPVDLNWMASRVTRRPSLKLTLDLTLRKDKLRQLSDKNVLTSIWTKDKQLLEDFLVERWLLGNEALGTVSWEKKEVHFWSIKVSFSSKMPIIWTLNCFLGCIYSILYSIYSICSSKLTFKSWGRKKLYKLSKLGGIGGER